MSLLPGRYNFKVWRGATTYKRIQIDENNSPKNLGGCTARLTISIPHRDPINFSSDSSINVDPSGIVEIKLTDEETATFDWPKGNYQLIITYPSGDSDPYLYGRIQVLGI